MKLVAALLAGLFVVAAAAPSDVAPIVTDDGYYIQPGSDATDAVVGRAVSDARSAGSRFYVVVLSEEPGAGATFFADSILDRLPDQTGTVLVVAPETVGWAKNLDDVWTTQQLDDALDASLDGATSDDVVQIFVGELVGSPSGGSGDGGGGGLWIVLLILVVIGGGIAFFVWRGSRSRTRHIAEQLAELKAKAQAQIDAIANDILDDEDEVTEADNPKATQHFESATATYSDASTRLASAATATEVVDITADLDEAIWHLDAAEAILDGKPVPDKPERPTVPAPEPVREEPTETPSYGPSGATTPPLPTYERRSTRRSGFGADDMLKTVLAMQAMRTLSGGRRRSGSSHSGSSRSGSSSRARSSGRSRGGGRRRR